MGGNWIYIIVAVFIGLGKLLEYMREQRDIKVARENAAKQREEAIGTGRDPAVQTQAPAAPNQARPQPATAAQTRDQRMRELAAKRQAELRDLRERQAQNRAQRGTQDASASTRSPRMPETSSSSRSARVLKPGTPKQRTEQPTPKAKSKPSGVNTARESQLRRERERQREIAQQREIELDAQRRAQDTKRRAAQTKKRERDQQLLRTAETARLASASGADMSKSIRELLTGGTAGSRRDRLRQVIAINEILDKPVSQREPRQLY